MRKMKNHRAVFLAILCSFFIYLCDLSFIEAESTVFLTGWPSNYTFITRLLSNQINQGSQSLSDTSYVLPSWSRPVLIQEQTPASSSAAQFLNSVQNSRPQGFPLNFSHGYNSQFSLEVVPRNQTRNFSGNFYQSYFGISQPSFSADEHLSRGNTYFLAGEYELAIEELKRADDFLPTINEEVSLLLGMAYQALVNNYLKEAEKYLKQAVSAQSVTTKARLQLAQFYYQQGSYDEAIEEFRRVVEKEPENGEAVKALALSYFKANNLTKALAELHKAEMINPNDLEVLYTMGVILHEKHLFAEALPYYQRIIDRMPESGWAEEARNHIQNIALIGSAATIEDLEEEIALLINSAPGPEDVPDLALMVLLDDIQYKLLPNDTLINRTHKLFKILADRGKEAGEITLSYDSSYQTITVDLARVINPDGTIIGVGNEDIQEVAPYADFPFYSNVKLLIISMPGLMVGSVVEYQVTIEDIPTSKRYTPREIDKGFILASANPIKKAWINVTVPEERELNITFVNGEPIEPEITVDGEMKHFVWRLSDIPAIIIQPMMPPLLDISPILAITSLPSWKIIVDWWRELASEAMVINDEISLQVQRLTDNLFTQKERAAALFHWVAAHIRYVGLEYGKGDVRPRKSSQVYDNKYGDCKDKTILLITMLRQAGIEAYPVLISTLFNGRAWEEIPRIDVFNHVITLCIIDDEWIWLDPAVETISFGDIHGGILDREALVIFDDGYQFMRTPIGIPEKNMEHENMTIHVAEDSSAVVSSTITTSGINAIYRRAFFKGLDPLYIRQHLEATVKGRTTGGRLIDFTMSDPDDLNIPHTVKLKYTAPDYIDWKDHTGFIEPSILSANKAGITDDLRLYPVFLGNTSVGEYIVHINLPENIKVSLLPPSVTLEIPQILFISEYTLADHTLIYHLRYEKRDLSIPPEDYSDYKQLQEQVDKELKRKIIVEKEDTL